MCADEIQTAADDVIQTTTAEKNFQILQDHMTHLSEMIDCCPVFMAVMEDAELAAVYELVDLEHQQEISTSNLLKHMHYMLTASMLRELRLMGWTDKQFCTSAFTEAEILKASAGCSQTKDSERIRMRLLDPLYCQKQGGCVRAGCQVPQRSGLNLNRTIHIPKISLPPFTEIVTA